MATPTAIAVFESGTRPALGLSVRMDRDSKSNLISHSNASRFLSGQ